MPIAEETFFLPVSKLAPMIRDGKLSPVELAEGFLDRLDKQKFGAVITVARAPALKEAREAEAQIKAGKYVGPLHGVPYGVKDLLATKGLPTTWGAAPYKDRVIDRDATVVTKLRAAGAVLVAKLAMVELAGAFGYDTADASFTGPCLNPWNTSHWSGGSSSGPGAAVAAGLVPFAIGSETSGSIITPAAYSGVTGLRPTYGRISRHGAMALSWTLDKLGPMTRSAEDAAIVLAAIAGRDPLDRTSRDRPYQVDLELGSKPKIGLLVGATQGQAGVKKNMLAAIEELKKFCDVDEANPVAMPRLPFGAAVGVIVDAEGASAFRDLIDSGRVKELQDPADRVGGYAAMATPAVDYLHAMRLRVKMRKAMAEMFGKHDLLIGPGRGTVAPKIGEKGKMTYPRGEGGSTGVIPAGNIAGHPALCVPTGLGEEGLPTSLQFVGPAWSEGLMLAVGAEYQRRTAWHLARPGEKK